jgi:hypothetical protein
VTKCGRNRKIYLGLLLVFAAAVPMLGWAHSEGIEAADPSTPAALLRFKGATVGYTQIRATRLSWRDRFGGNDSEMPSVHDLKSGHNRAGSSSPRAAPQAPPTTPQ